MNKLTRVTLADSLLTQLRQQILSGRLSPGEAMPSERELREAFGVGRTTVREALQGLVAAGFVERRNHQLVVADPARLEEHEVDYAQLAATISVEDVYETRKLLECRIVEVAARNWADDDLDTIRGPLEAMREPTDEQAYHVADLEFHTAIARVAKRPVLARVYESNIHLLFRLPAFWRVFPRVDSEAEPRTVGAGWAGHRRVFEAIEARDADAAVRATYDLLDRVQRDLVERIAHARRTGALTDPSAAGSAPAGPRPAADPDR
jgi:GntR family transcriptional repressor for pyruvate dehydrogenase complex